MPRISQILKKATPKNRKNTFSCLKAFFSKRFRDLRPKIARIATNSKVWQLWHPRSWPKVSTGDWASFLIVVVVAAAAAEAAFVVIACLREADVGPKSHCFKLLSAFTLEEARKGHFGSCNVLPCSSCSTGCPSHIVLF